MTQERDSDELPACFFQTVSGQDYCLLPGLVWLSWLGAILQNQRSLVRVIGPAVAVQTSGGQTDWPSVVAVSSVKGGGRD